MFLIVGENSEIGSATARLIRSEGRRVLATTRRRGAHSDQIELDFNSPIQDLSLPKTITSACIFVAVARLASCDADPVGSAFINVDRTIALIDLLLARGIYTLFLSTNQVFNGEHPNVLPDA